MKFILRWLLRPLVRRWAIECLFAQNRGVRFPRPIRAEEDDYNKGVRDMTAPSDGEIYAMVSQIGMTPEEIESINAAIDAKLAQSPQVGAVPS